MALPEVKDIIPELICIGVDAAICGIIYSVYKYNNYAIQEIKVILKFYTFLSMKSFHHLIFKIFVIL